MPPLPPRLPSSAAMFMKLLIFRCKLPSGISRRSLPHSHEKTQPFGAVSGRGGMGFRLRGSCVISLSQAPLPRHAVKLERGVNSNVDFWMLKAGLDLQLSKEGCVDRSYDRLSVPQECYGYAVERRKVDEVDRSCLSSACIFKLKDTRSIRTVERIDAPCWSSARYQVVFRPTLAI